MSAFDTQSQDAGDVAEKVREALRFLPTEERLSIPLGVFIVTASEIGIPKAALMELVSSAIDDWLRAQRKGGRK